jgi:iron complex outermembrane receptor protein
MQAFQSKYSPMILGLAGAACLSNSPLALAQGTARLEEVLVTAQLRDESIQEVPISITSMTGDRLTARFASGDDILALSSAAPGLYIETSNGRLAPRFYLRGLGNADFTSAASQPVSVDDGRRGDGEGGPQGLPAL